MKTKLLLIASMALSLLGVLPAKADSALVLSETAAQQIAPKNHWMRPFFGIRTLPLYTFAVKSQGGATKVTAVKVRIPSNARMPEQLYVYDGANQLASALPDTTTRLTDLNGFALDVADGVTKTLTIKADFPPGAADIGAYGEYGQVCIVSVDCLTAAGESKTFMATTSFVSNEQRLFRPMAANISLAETPTAEAVKDVDGVLTAIRGNFVIGFTPEGGDLSMPSGDDFVVIAQVGREEIPCQVSIVGGAVSRIANGTTYNVGIQARLPLTIPGAQHQRSGPVSFSLRQVTWRNDPGSSSIATAQTWGMPNWKTLTTATLPKADPETAVTKPRLPKVTAKIWREIQDMLKPDSNGFMPQIHSESGIYIVNGTNPNRDMKLVFPVVVPTGIPDQAKTIGQIASVDLTITPTTMTPVFKAPADLTADSRDNLVEYTAQSITRIPTTGQDTIANFEVVLNGLHVQGKALRTGPSSATLQFYWDCESGYPNSAGQSLDCFDLSAADADGSTPGQPMRFELGVGQVAKAAGSFQIGVKAAPGAIALQTSRDLITWSSVDFEYGPMQLDPLGGNTATGTVSVSDSVLTMPDAPARYFRVVVP